MLKIQLKKIKLVFVYENVLYVNSSTAIILYKLVLLLEILYKNQKIMMLTNAYTRIISSGVVTGWHVIFNFLTDAVDINAYILQNIRRHSSPEATCLWLVKEEFKSEHLLWSRSLIRGFFRWHHNLTSVILFMNIIMLL